MNNIKNKISYFLWHNWVVDRIEDILFKMANYVYSKRKPEKGFVETYRKIKSK